MPRYRSRGADYGKRLDRVSRGIRLSHLNGYTVTADARNCFGVVYRERDIRGKTRICFLESSSFLLVILAMTSAIPAHAMHSGIDPFTGRGRGFWSSLISALLATALFRCWNILLFFTGWGTMVTLISHYVYPLAIQPTLLTVLVPVASTQPFVHLKKIHIDWVPCSVSSSHTVPPLVLKGTTKVVGSGLRSSLAVGLSPASCGFMCPVWASINEATPTFLTQVSQMSCQSFQKWP